MVAGMVQLIAATAGVDRVRSRRTGMSGASSSGGPRTEDGAGHGSCANGRGDGSGGSDAWGSSAVRQGGGRHAVPGGECANPDGTTPDAAIFDALERQAAGRRFVQVADAAAAAAYGAQWRCQGAATATVCGKGSRAVTATAVAVAAALRWLARAAFRQAAAPAAWVLQAARPVISQAVQWLPAPVQAATADLLATMSACLRGGLTTSEGSQDEWWKHDPHRRPSLWTPEGWRRLAADARSRLPSFQALLLSLSRAVPGFADCVLLFHRHEALCATYPPSADTAAAYRTQT